MGGFDLESISEATSGAIGSLLSTTILYPLDTCKTRYQAEVRAHGRQKYRSILPQIHTCLCICICVDFVLFLIWVCDRVGV